MRIFHWIHRKFRQNDEHDYDYGVKDSSDGRWPRILQDKTPCLENYLDEGAKRVRIQTEDKVKGCSRKDINYSTVNEDTEALLGRRDSTVTELFSNLQNGLLAIGTFGIDQNGQDYGYESMDTDDDFLFKEEELVDPIEVEVLEGKLEEVFGLKNEGPHLKQNKAVSTEHKGFVKKYSTSDLGKQISGYDNKGNTNHGNKIYPLQEFFEVPLLAGTVTEENRTTLADLFSRSKNYRSSNMLDDVPKAEFKSEVVENKIRVDSQEKSSRSLVKKVLKWKKRGGELHRPKQWMMKMLKKKIHPEVPAELDANEVIGYLDVSKTFVNASKYKELNISNSSVDGNDSLTRGTYEPVSLLRDSSRGSQECWIKTDSEYVVLEL